MLYDAFTMLNNKGKRKNIRKMKKIEYIFSAMLLAFLGGCTADGLDQNPETKDGYVNMRRLMQKC